MSQKEKRIYTTLSVIILIGMLICACFGWRHSPYSRSWHLAFYTLLLANSALSIRRTRNIPAPDTLIKLFPTPTQPTPERASL